MRSEQKARNGAFFQKTKCQAVPNSPLVYLSLDMFYNLTILINCYFISLLNMGPHNIHLLGQLICERVPIAFSKSEKHCEKTLITWLTFLKCRKRSIICQVEKRLQNSSALLNISCLSPLFFISTCALAGFFSCTHPAPPQFPLGASSCGLAFTKLNILQSYNLAIAFLAFTPRSWKFRSTQKPTIEIFIIALFIIGKTWKQPQYPAVTEGFNSCSIQTWDIILCS